MYPATPGGAVASHSLYHVPAASAPDAAVSRTFRRGFLLSLLTIASLLACGDGGVSVTSPDDALTQLSLIDAELVLVGGDGQEAEVASVLPEPLAIQVLDEAGEPFPGAPIEWAFTQGLGMGIGIVSDRIAMRTDANGNATVRWQLGTEAGPQSASVRIVLPSSSAAGTDGASPAPNNDNGKKLGFHAGGRPGSAESIQVTPDDTTVVERDSLQLDAEVHDKHGNLVEASSLSWSSSDAAVAQVNERGLVHVLRKGVVSISAKYGPAEGSATLTASALGDEDPTVANQAPTASITSPARDITIALGQAVDFQGSASDADGSIASHRWTFGDGGASSREDPGSYSYQSAGTYSATYEVTDDDGARGVARRTITVASNSPSGSPTFLFSSDWLTATGTSSTALLDVSKDLPWDAEKGDRNGGVAVTDTVPWPDGIPNGLTISHVGGSDNPGVRLDRSLPRFTSGKRGYRVYFRNILPDAHAIPSDRHPWQDAAGGSNTNWEFNVSVGQAGKFAPYFELHGNCPDCEGTHWTRWTIGGEVQGRSESTLVPKDSVYRFEFLLTHHPTGDSVDIEIKMYNADGSIRVDSDEWKRVSDGQPSSVVSWYAFNPANKDNLQDLQVGTNGWGGGTTNRSYVTWHWAGMAVCSDWCGRYGNGGTEGN